jgi:hypothetical protein
MVPEELSENRVYVKGKVKTAPNLVIAIQCVKLVNSLNYLLQTCCKCKVHPACSVLEQKPNVLLQSFLFHTHPGSTKVD